MSRRKTVGVENDGDFSMPFGEPVYSEPREPRPSHIGDVTQLTTEPVKTRKKQAIGFRPPRERSTK